MAHEDRPAILALQVLRPAVSAALVLLAHLVASLVPWGLLVNDDQWVLRRAPEWPKALGHSHPMVQPESPGLRVLATGSKNTDPATTAKVRALSRESQRLVKPTKLQQLRSFGTSPASLFEIKPTRF